MKTEPTIAKREELPHGLRCPKCGGGRLRVIYTRPVWGRGVRRRRECRACRHRITTTERIR